MTMSNDLLKQCSKCGRYLPLNHFNKRKSTRDGYLKTCKDCIIEARRKNKVTSTPSTTKKWKPYGWLGEYLGYSKLADCIIVTEKKGKGK